MSVLKTKPSDEAAVTLTGALAELLVNWWRGDRVRVSPSQGRLLRMRPPCVVRLGKRVYEITQRRVGNTPTGPFVSYVCDDGEQNCELWVFPVGLTEQPRVLVRSSAGERELCVSDVVVFG